ncbi:HAMP domain-containing protein [Paenibacillus psychroresistens]|uniref:HAMP domain-containing protein n=1 Tax=Paenibacillus psychroresistens TaxID=1778678 RepID=A0A6B8RUC4_9BACL|nr:sensor histidine kinase [Paenibacillus psychroresistens]QGQ99412.1 HAMP domain-containing protein [Paenibacillus psychroresistens]
MIKPKTIQFKLFLHYSLLIVCIILVFVSTFYIYISRILEDKASESLYQISNSVSSQLDSELKNMNSTSDKILFSKPLIELFFSDIFLLNNASITKQRQFNSILYSIIGTGRELFQINMFQLGGSFAGLGNYSSFTQFSPTAIQAIPWVQETVQGDGKKIITQPHPDSWRQSNKTVISLTRAFSAGFGQKVNSVIEIQQDYTVLLDIVNNALANPDLQKEQSNKIYIFNEKGQLIYPLTAAATDSNESNLEETALFYWQQLKSHGGNTSTFTVNNPATKSKDMLAYTSSSFSDWIVLSTVSEKELLQPVNTFRNTTLLLGLISILITLMISFLFSRTLTTPIKRIHKSIKNLSLSTLSPKAAFPIHSGFNELEHLNYAFLEMCLRLKESLDEAVSSRAHEIEAQMFALQAQMNPHFLYNTLANISIMAEESNQTAIVDVCDSLSNMLRYVSSEDAAPVYMEQELKHTLDYLNLMKLRYEDQLIFEINIPDTMLEIQIPKLVIQPLVENCTKYAFKSNPPWRIRITGSSYADRWELSISDNGEGFEPGVIEGLKEQFRTADLLKSMPSLKINGMGLMNIYIRLKLLYGDKMIFKLDNRFEGGAVITIGVKHSQ